MSTTDNSLTKTTTPPPTNGPSPSTSPPSNTKSAAMTTATTTNGTLSTLSSSSSPSSSPPTTSLQSPNAATTSASPPSSATLNVPKQTTSKPSRQGTNPDKGLVTTSSTTTPATDKYGGLSPGLPAALSLSPGGGGSVRLGTRSPSSIPSSPASIHSSSSAIFERDIEPLGLPSLSVPLQNAPVTTASSTHPLRSSTIGSSHTTNTNPHRIPRSKTTEALELTVPSVLDSAVSALTSVDEAGANITVLSPVPVQPNHSLGQSLSGSAMQSPTSQHSQPSPLSSQFNQTQILGGNGIGSLGSMASGTSAGSPSPPTMSLLLQGMGMSGLVSASASVSGNAASVSGLQTGSGFASPMSSSRAPSPARSASPPAAATSLTAVTANNLSVSDISPGAAGGSPRSIAKDASASSPHKRPSLPPPSGPGLAPNPNMPSPNMRASNRLSFISYTDLLTSAPIASQSLGSVLNPGSNEPPTHLVVVDPDVPSSGILGMTPTASSGNLPLGGAIGSLNVSNPTDKVDVDSLGSVGLSTTGEWGREGLGGGLEERLERLWNAERELNERGRVMGPAGAGAKSIGSRSTSAGGTVDRSLPTSAQTGASTSAAPAATLSTTITPPTST